jgi:phage repressor protein C with HTH and peptisase S24 domain
VRPPVFGLARVHHDSMRPTLEPGDRLLVRYAAPVTAGQLVLARFPDGTLAVKRAVERRETRSGGLGWWLLSDNPDEGVDSRHRGALADADVVAVVVARIWPRPRLVRGM